MSFYVAGTVRLLFRAKDTSLDTRLATIHLFLFCRENIGLEIQRHFKTLPYYKESFINESQNTSYFLS